MKGKLPEMAVNHIMARALQVLMAFDVHKVQIPVCWSLIWKL